MKPNKLIALSAKKILVAGLTLSSFLIVSCTTNDPATPTTDQNETASAIAKLTKKAEKKKKSLKNLAVIPPPIIVAPKENILDNKPVEDLNTIYFDFDSDVLSGNAKEKIEENYAQIKDLSKEIVINIEGHTDESGSTEYNLVLSEKRANSVVDYLNELGANPDNYKILSYGEERPVSKNNSKNRRSEFTLKK